MEGATSPVGNGVDHARAVLGGVGANAERACKFGCVYCFAAEPAYTPAPSAHDVLRQGVPADANVLMLGADTELFQDRVEAHRTLELAARSGCDVTFATKANLSPGTVSFLAGLRDDMGERGSVLSVMVSLPVLRRYREIEPRVPSPRVRFRLLERLRKAGLNPFVGIRPLLPPHMVEDDEVLEIVERTRDCALGYIMGPYWFDRDSLGLLGSGLPLVRRPVHWLDDGTTWWVYEDLDREVRLKEEARRRGVVVWERSSEAVRAIRQLVVSGRP